MSFCIAVCVTVCVVLVLLRWIHYPLSVDTLKERTSHQEDGSLSKVLTVQSLGPMFNPQDPHKSWALHYKSKQVESNWRRHQLLTLDLHLFVDKRIHMHTDLYTHVHIHMQIYASMQAHINVQVCADPHAYTKYEQKSIHIRTFTQVHIKTYTSTHAYTCTNVHMDIRTHTNTYAHAQYTHKFTYTCMHAHMYISAPSQIYTHMHTDIHRHTIQP